MFEKCGASISVIKHYRLTLNSSADLPMYFVMSRMSESENMRISPDTAYTFGESPNLSMP